MKVQFSRKQNQCFLTACARIVMLVGAIRSGKTFVGYFMFVNALLKVIRNNMPGDVVIIAKTERTALRNIINPMFQLFGKQNMSYKRGTGELTLFGKLVYVIGMNDERAEEKIRGMTIVLAFGDEITLWPEAAFVQLLGRMSVEGAQLIGTTNPDSPFHWLKKNFLDKGPNANIPEDDKLDIQIFHFTLNDNETLTKKYKRNLSKEFTGVFYKRFILGEWCIAEGVIYDMFDEQVNVFPNNYTPEYPEGDEWSVSVDFGAGNPTRFGLFRHNSQTECDYMMREYSYDPKEQRNQKTTVELKRDLIEFVNKYNQEVAAQFGENTREYYIHSCPPAKKLKIYVDPSAAILITEFFSSSCDERFEYVIRANNDVVDGISHVQSQLELRKLQIHGSCKEALEEFQVYAWDEKAQEKGEDKPIKKKDHSMDMIRYYCYTRKRPRTANKRKLVGKGIR